ncbi:MAG: epoxyqueuosine reductase [Deltaproteobacteria bacterium]|nr:epoxyqueuosine reductase [Deltaproteobacteria bacterium]
MMQEEISAAWVVSLIKDFALRSPHNSLHNKAGDKAWDEPLVGFSRGSDPLYDEFKNHIGAFHWTPEEIFSLTFPETRASAAELTVISWILPQTAATKRDNQLEQRFPSERWTRSRSFGEQFNVELRRHLLGSLQEAGCQAMAPEFSPLKKGEISERYGRASTWSERHAAFAAGLGTFGLCDGLITAAGKAMRCGSVIARVKLPPTFRPYQDHHAYCLYYAKGTCGKCVERCPVEAISTAKGHDKEKCRTHTQETTRDYVKTNFGIDTYGCGLCQTGVPCESQIPMKP